MLSPPQPVIPIVPGQAVTDSHEPHEHHCPLHAQEPQLWPFVPAMTAPKRKPSGGGGGGGASLSWGGYSLGAVSTSPSRRIKRGESDHGSGGGGGSGAQYGGSLLRNSVVTSTTCRPESGAVSGGYKVGAGGGEPNLTTRNSRDGGGAGVATTTAMARPCSPTRSSVGCTCVVL